MSAKQRSRAYRREQEKKHRQHKPAGPTPKRPSYEQNKRNAVRSSLKTGQWMDWS